MIRLLFLVFIFSLILISPTNADFNDKKVIKNNQFKATTLDFSQVKTTNNSPADTLFNINGISPGGYQVSTVRLKNDGQLDPTYLINFSKIGGNDNFCRQLEINFTKDSKSLYQSSLTDLNFKINLDEQQKFSDFLIIIKLNNNYLSSGNDFCDFDIVITGSNNPDQSLSSGFRYQRKINNHISFN